MSALAIQDVLRDAAERLALAGIHSSVLDARLLLAHALGVEREGLLRVRQVDQAGQEEFETLLARRTAREPVAYITGKKEFFGIDLEVGPGVLVPRPETETLIEEALKAFPDRNQSLRVVDFGTGSGSLLIALLLRYPRAAGIGVDASSEALAWAERNIRTHGLRGRASLLQSNWNAEGQFDVVLANPPYLTDDEYVHAAPEISRYEPRMALAGGCDGLAAYRALAPRIAQALAAGGRAFVEVGAQQMPAVGGILASFGLEVVCVAPDLAGIARCIVAGRPQGRVRQKTVGKEIASR